MEDKSFEFLTKIYSELTEFRKETTEFRKETTEFRKETNSRLDKIETTLEHDIKTNLQSLHERAVTNTDRLQEHSERLNTIENKLDYLALSVNSQDRRLEVVESSRKRKVK